MPPKRATSITGAKCGARKRSTTGKGVSTSVSTPLKHTDKVEVAMSTASQSGQLSPDLPLGHLAL